VPETLNIIGMKQKDVHEKGVHVMSVEQVKVCAVTDSRLLGTLAGEAEFSCARCGATAHDKNNVCEPIAIEPDH